MSPILLIFIFQFTYILGDISNSPFCDICECNNSLGTVECTKEIAHLNVLNDTKFWFDAQANKSYAYNKVSIQHSGIGVVTTIPQSPLKILDLSNNRIQHIDDGSFKNLQEMIELHLSNNQLDTKVLTANTLQGVYTPGAYEPLRNLKVLKLDGNIIHSLNQDFFQHTTMLTTLDLHANPIKIIDANLRIALGTLQHLQNLDLSYTQLWRIPFPMFHTLRDVEYLNLTGNEFEEIPKALNNGQNMKYLNLDNNPIHNITEKNGFPKMENLRELHLSFMPNLTTIEAHSLCGLINLEVLYLENNHKLVHLDEFSMSVKGELVEGKTWPPLKKLYLRNNELSYLDHSLVSHWENLEDIDIRDNPWACECQNQWMIDELMKKILKLDKNKTENVKCAAPIEMAQMNLMDLSLKNSSMRCLDLYGNRPERDASIVIGILVGLLIGIPLVLGCMFCYKKNFFGYLESGPAAYSRKFYNRATADDGDVF